MIAEGRIPNRGGVFIDAYNQSINEEVAGTITTRVDASNHIFVTDICNTKEKILTPTKVSIGTIASRSFEEHLGGGISRCVKTDDSLAIMEKVIKIGNYSPSGHNASTIVDGNGISPAVMENHGTVTAVVEPQVLAPKRTEFGKAIRKQYESHEIEMSRHDMTTMEPRTDGITNTLTSVQKDNYLAIPEATSKGYAEAYEGDSVNLAVPNSKTRRGRVGDQMANTLDTGCQQGVVTPNYRIRKLSPRECFRLMGVEDADIDKLLSAGISNSQLYKCAGNSIVVDTLYHIFRKAFVDTGNENQQQTLF